MKWEIRKYLAEDKDVWDEFVDSSRNSTFLFRRDFMDYHADRFTDCSLMAYRNGRLAAILPANITSRTLHSHQGLSYGGWCLPQRGLDGTDILTLWEEWIEWCRGNDIQSVFYKPLPYIYHLMPSQEDIFMLGRYGQPVESNLSSAIDLRHNPGFNKLQKRHLAHISPSVEYGFFSGARPESISDFHRLLSDCLRERHQTSPVHSLQEMILLMGRFPDNIAVWHATDRGELLAVVCAFVTPMCLHCQYIATSPSGRERNVLPGLVMQMINHAAASGVRFFDFGISNEDHGRILNEGLNRQKTSFGASGVSYSTWKINIPE